MPYKFNPFSRTLDLIQQASPGGSGGDFQTGSIIWWPQDTPPSGWLKCDGSLVSTQDYPELFSLIGYTFGQGGGGQDESLIATHSDYTSETGTARASSEYSSAYLAWYCLDNTAKNYCSVSQNAGEWWEYEFTAPKKATKFGIEVKDSGFTVNLEASNDGQNYNTLKSGINLSQGDNLIEIPEDVQGEYLIYRLKKTSAGKWFWFDNFQLYSTNSDLFGLPNIDTGINNVIAIIKT